MERRATSTAADDATLWRAVAAEDEDARQELARAVREVCGPVLRRKGVPAHELDDLLQEAQLSVLRYAARRPAPPRDLRGFLKWRARGVFSDYVREKWRRGRLQEIDEGVASGAADVAQPAALAELRAALEHCVERLKKNQRSVWTLRRDEGVGPREIGERLGVPYATVGVLFHRARQALADCLRRKGVAV